MDFPRRCLQSQPHSLLSDYIEASTVIHICPKAGNQLPPTPTAGNQLPLTTDGDQLQLPEECFVCMMELTYPIGRPDTCPLHKCHYECLVTWTDAPLNRDRNPYCPVCRLEFKSIKKTSTSGAEDEDIQIRDQDFFEPYVPIDWSVVRREARLEVERQRDLYHPGWRTDQDFLQSLEEERRRGRPG